MRLIMATCIHCKKDSDNDVCKDCIGVDLLKRQMELNKEKQKKADADRQKRNESAKKNPYRNPN
jgi:hypothetical protein